MSKLTQCHPNAWRRSLTNCVFCEGPDRSARASPAPSCSPSHSRFSWGSANRRGCRWVGASAATPSIAEPSVASEVEIELTVGIETHVQLRTKTKAFCSCPNEYGGDVNSHVCPVCMGHPGTLPVLNDEVVRSAVKAGLSLNCSIAPMSKFDRKQYFYADLPKGYQISQFDEPICTGGSVEVILGEKAKKVNIERLHIEEDAGKTTYAGSSDRLAGSESSLVDYNRAGVPLLEIVSSPDMQSGEEAAAYGAEIQRIMRYLGVSDGNMAEGSMRCDVNVSVAPKGADKLGTKVEIKNMNSFSGMQKAIDYEAERQSQLVRDGRSQDIVQETRLWDENRQVTYTMRKKEGLADYRYFPEPDLPPLQVNDGFVQEMKQNLPELPSQRRERYLELGLPRKNVLVLTDDVDIGNFFDGVLERGAPAKTVANWLIGDITAYCKSEKVRFSDLKLAPGALAEMVSLIDSKVISGKIGKQILPDLLAGKGNDGVKSFVEKKGLLQISDSAEIEKIIDTVITGNPKQVEQFRGGKTKLMGFFVGQVMKKSKGRASPELVNRILQQRLQG